VHLVIDICQGIGIAAAVGIRPFLPTLAVGALAAGSVEIHFKHTDYGFLQGAPFLLVIVAAAIVLVGVERTLGPARLERRPFVLALGAVGLGLGAVLFAGSLCRGHYVVWPGYVGGAVCAVIGAAATRPLFARVRARLDPATAAALPVYAEAAAVLLAALSVVAFPIGPIGLLLLLWLLWSGRRREGQKYAGLRILK
jgi:uncharacterized membrane protein YgdD (TMEM256/DUF423 family)